MKLGGDCELLWDRRSGVSRANSRTGLVCLLGEVLDLCEQTSGEAASVLFDFCDNMPRDVAAGLSFCFDIQKIIKRFLQGWW